MTLPKNLNIVLISLLVGSLSGATFGSLATFSIVRQGWIVFPETKDPVAALSIQNNSLSDAVAKVEPAVVSIVATKDVQTFRRLDQDPFFRLWGGWFGLPDTQPAPEYETERRQVGGGTGFIVRSNGTILTNKHVVEDMDAEYTVLLNDGTEYPAEVVALDPANDIAVVKITQDNISLPVVTLGDSSKLLLGEQVIAVGNALGEFRNTVSAGVISGLSRSVVAAGSQQGPEQLNGVIQTDAAINSGNSGGPLANRFGEVIGMNTAVSTRGENIGFAIPVNEVKVVLDSVEQYGRVVRPFLGVQYIIVNEQIATDKKLSSDYGALLISENNNPAIVPYSPADRAGLKEGDIILELSGQKITEDTPLAMLISKYKVGDKLDLVVKRDKEELRLSVELVERK